MPTLWRAWLPTVIGKGHQMWTRFWFWLLTCLGRDPRGLFRFFDGRRWRTADPLAVARALFTHPGFDWDETPQLLLTGRSEIQLQACGIIGEAVRASFQILPLNQGGLSDRECLDILTAFRNYLGAVKKNGSLFPISQDCTGSPPVETCVTRPGSDCGSTPTGPSAARPGSLEEAMSAG